MQEHPGHPTWVEHHPHGFLAFVFSPTRSNIPISVSNAVWIHLGSVEVTIRLSEYKNTTFAFYSICPSYIHRCPLSFDRIVLPAKCATLLLLLPPPALSSTRDPQWRTTASTTTLNMVGDSGYPCVTSLSLWKGSPEYPPRLRHHMESLPIPVKEVKGPGPRTISLQDI